MKFTGRLLIVTHHQNISGPDREEKKKNKYNNNNKIFSRGKERGKEYWCRRMWRVRTFGTGAESVPVTSETLCLAFRQGYPTKRSQAPRYMTRKYLLSQIRDRYARASYSIYCGLPFSIVRRILALGKSILKVSGQVQPQTRADRRPRSDVDKLGKA